MAYASTIGGGRFTSFTQIPTNIYVAPELRNEVWQPIEVTRHQLLYQEVSKHFNELPKPSGMHIREGHTFESRAVVLNNPLHPVEISEWGQLNNLGGGGKGGVVNAKTPTSRATRNTVIRNRRALFDTAIQTLRNQIDAAIKKITGVNRPGHAPEALPSGATAANKATHAALKKQYTEREKKWKSAMKNVASNPALSHLRPIPEDVEKFKKGHENLIQLFKTGGYFVAPKLATLELRTNPLIYQMGKGENYIELDGLIYNKAQHRVIILEMKKGKGVSGTEDAQQMRKAAALFRKWGLEITGRVPTVELYFAAGAAESFASSKTYHFNSEKNNVQNWPIRKIEEAVAARADHIVYIRTPIFLLTGMGVADLLRIDPKKMTQLMAATTLAYESIGEAIKPFFREKDRRITDADMRPYAVVHSGGTIANPTWRLATESEIKNESGPTLHLNLAGLINTRQNIKSKIPQAWLPKQGAGVLPTMKLARVAEGILYINHVKSKINNPATTNAKRNALRQNLKSHIKLLLSNKYKEFLKVNEQTRLRNMLTSTIPGASPVRPVAASPVKNQKYYSRVLKAAAKRPATYYKSTTGTFKTKPASAVKVGYTKVHPERLLPNYFFKGGAPVNIGNVTANNVKQLDDEALNRWISIILKNVSSAAPITSSKVKQYGLILRTALNNRKPLSANAKPSAKEKRKLMIKLMEQTYKAVKGSMTIRGLPHSPNRSPTQFSPSPNRGAARQAPANSPQTTGRSARSRVRTVRN